MNSFVTPEKIENFFGTFTPKFGPKGGACCRFKTTEKMDKEVSQIFIDFGVRDSESVQKTSK